MKIKNCCIFTTQHAEYDQIRNAALEAEKIGADVIYNWDHFTLYIKKIILNGLKEKEEKESILSVGLC